MTSPLATTRAYYEDKFRAHGPVPGGVDWGHARAQELRFEQLCKLLPRGHAGTAPVSLNDLGCGYGALLDHLLAAGEPVDYLGIDLVPAMVDAARQRHAAHGQFVVGSCCPRVADYAVASGLFDVRGQVPEAAWREFMLEVLDDLHAHSRLGFAFNALTSYSDPGRMRPDLYYADPLALFDICKRRYSKQVALLHDYPLYEFTMIVRLTDG